MLIFIIQTWWEWLDYWMSQDSSNWHSIAWALDYNPIVIGMHLIAGTTLALSFFTIAGGASYLARKQGFLTKEHRNITFFFVTFIIMCGLTFVFREITFFTPIFWIYGSIKMVTAVFALLTAVTYIRAVPDFAKMPSAKEYKKAIEEKEIIERKSILLKEHLDVWKADVGYHISLLKGQQKALTDDLASKGIPVTPLLDDEHTTLNPEKKAQALASLEKMQEELSALLENINDNMTKN
jgi:hypothetical protein